MSICRRREQGVIKLCTPKNGSAGRAHCFRILYLLTLVLLIPCDPRDIEAPHRNRGVNNLDNDYTNIVGLYALAAAMQLIHKTEWLILIIVAINNVFWACSWKMQLGWNAEHQWDRKIKLKKGWPTIKIKLEKNPGKQSEVENWDGYV